jgi:galactokinase
VQGPFWALRDAGFDLPGADVVVRGGVPFGGGLSSSAAIEVALVALGAAMAGREPDGGVLAAHAAGLSSAAAVSGCRVAISSPPFFQT